MDYSELSATEAARFIRDGGITSQDLTAALLRRIDAAADLYAFVTVDHEGALKTAADADRRHDQGASPRPLNGVPLVIKDNIHVAGLPNTAGTPALRTFVPREHAPVAKALIDAGAVVLGKTNMHELAFGITSNNAAFGAVRTPYDKRRFAGGSSGGTGAAIAARLAPAGLGTDTGGSVRIPAALNGIVGLRPTLGRYSQDGITPIAHTRDTAGPMARAVCDLVLLDQVITGDRSPVSAAALDTIRLGVARGAFYQDLDNEVAQSMEKALAVLRAAGVHIVEVEIPGLADADELVSFPVAMYEAKSDLAAYLDRYRTGLTVRAVTDRIASPDVKGIYERLILGPGAPTESTYRAAIGQHRPRLQRLYADTYAKYRIDAVIFPTTPLPAQLLEQSDEVMLNGKSVPTMSAFIGNTGPGSNAGIPGLALPMGMTMNGLPLGVELDGPDGSDRRLLAIGLALESILDTIPAPQR